MTTKTNLCRRILAGLAITAAAASLTSVACTLGDEAAQALYATTRDPGDDIRLGAGLVDAAAAVGQRRSA